MPKKSRKEQTTPWPKVLNDDERRARMNQIYFHLKTARITNNRQTADELNIHQDTVATYMHNPPIEFALKYCYMYGPDILEIYPELVWLRDRWMSEIKENLALLKQAAELQNPEMIKDLVEICEEGLAMYLNPELLKETRVIRGEAVRNIQDLEKVGPRRRLRDKDFRSARYKLNANT